MCLGCWRNLHLNRGSDKGGGVLQRILISTRHKSSGLQLQNWMHGLFLQLQNTENNLIWFWKQFKICTTKTYASEVEK
jgi:hypothetical protein